MQPSTASSVAYLGVLLAEQSLTDLLRSALHTVPGIDLAPLPKDIEVVRRGECAVILNHGEEATELVVDGRSVTGPAQDLVISRTAGTGGTRRRR